MMLTNYVRPLLSDPFEMRVDDLIDEAFNAVGNLRPMRQLAWNVYEKDNWFWVDAAVPGLTGKDVDLKIENSILTMSVINRKNEHNETLDYLVREIGSDTVSRSMKLPEYLDLDKVTASCQNGILTVGFPRLAGSPIRVIPIKEPVTV